MKKITSLFKAINILIIISIFVNTISAFPFYVFANKEEKEEEINLNSNNEINQEEVPLLYEVEDLRSDYYKVFKRADGTLQYSYYQEQVHYYENEKYVNVDASYKEETNEYIQKINKYSVKLPKKIHENKKIKLSYEDSSLEITYNDVNKVEGVITTSNIEDEKISTLKNISGSVKYPNIFNNVDLEIVSKANSFKENFIINEYINNFSFSYTMKLKKLSLIENDNLIRLVNENDEIIYEISPYYMKDANNNLSTDITCEISKTKEDEYIITITPNNDYLLHATYPVVIDPVTTYYSSSNSTSPIKTKTIVKGENTVIDGTLIVSKTGDGTLLYPGSYGIIEVTCTGLSIEPVVYAKLMIKGNSPTYVNPVIFGKLGTTSSYEEFNGNKLFFVSEKQEMVNVGDGYYTADFMPYFSGYGMNETTFVMSPEALNINEEQEYLGHSGTTKPTLAVVQMADGGMSPYREYENVSAGEAGTIYIDRALGNMFLEKNIYNDVNGRINLSLCYSSLNKDTNVGFGNGITTNFNEELKNVIDLGESRKKIIDSTGYTEYFYYDTNYGIYRSEDGNNRTLSYDETFSKYTLKDENCEKIFDSNGKLISIITNTNSGNTDLYDYIYITYDTSNKIESISVEDILIEFEYSSDGLLIKTIKIYKIPQQGQTANEDDLINKIIFTYYEETKNLRTINNYNKYKLLTQCFYTYDENNNLNKALYSLINTTVSEEENLLTEFLNNLYNSDNYEGVGLTYNTSNKVESYGVKILNEENIKTHMYIRFDDKKTIFTDHTGYEKTYLFDYFDHTICILDSLGYAIYYEYENFIGSISLGNPKFTYKNRIKYISEPMDIKYNPINNCSFEQIDYTSSWTILGGEIITNEQSPYGYNMLKLNSSATAYAKQRITLNAGTHQINYVGKVISGDEAVFGYIKVCDTEGNQISTAEDTFYNDEFKYLSHTFTLSTKKEVEIIIGIRSEERNLNLTDVGYFDNITIGDNIFNNINNLIENSSFEHISSWNYINRVNNDDNYDIYGSNKLKLPYGQTTYQEITYPSKGGDKFSLGGITKYVNGITKVKIRVKFYNSTNSDETSWYVLNFNPEITDTQFVTKNIVVEGASTTKYNKIKVEIINDGIGEAYIDNIFLYNTFNGNEYYYNEANNKLSKVINRTRIVEFNYLGSKISSIKTSTHNVELKEELLTNTPYYVTTQIIDELSNTHGEYTEQNISSYYNHNTGEQITFNGNYDEEGYFIEEVYDPFSANLISTKDEFGNTTTFNYNYYTGNIEAITNALSQVNAYYDTDNDGIIDKYIQGKKIPILNGENIDEFDKIDDVITGTKYNIETNGKVLYEFDEYGNLSKLIANDDSIYEFTYDNYRNIETIKLNDEMIKEYIYYYDNNFNTGLIEKEINYETSYIRYEYDDNYNITACYKGEINNNIEINEILCYTCIYKSDSQLYYYKDNLENIEYNYTYDVLGNLTKVTFIKDDKTNYIEYEYNSFNKIAKMHIFIDGNTQTTEYYYDENQKLAAYSIDEAVFVCPTDYIDSLKRVFNEDLLITLDTSEKQIYHKTYTYEDATLDYSSLVEADDYFELTSNRIKQQTTQIGTNVYITKYTYNEIGNITQIEYDGPSNTNDRVYVYEYDDRNYLEKEIVKNSSGDKILECNYEYDNNGNITNIFRTIKLNEYSTLPTEQSMVYNTSNEITSYTVDGTTYTFTDTNKYKDYTLVFDGTNLITMSNNNQTLNFTYNANGLRTSKTCGNEKVEYTYIGDQLYQEDIYYNNQLDHSIRYKYSPSKEVVGYEIIDAYTNTVIEEIFYEKNLQNDIVKLVNKEGEILGEYIYDAYGNIINNDDLTIYASANPFRYRSYYYDVETQLFYCNSRYYSPELCRFISPDSIEYLDPESINGLNLYCYCANNPIMNIDPSGHAWYNPLTWDWGEIAKGVGLVITGVAAIAVGVVTLPYGGWIAAVAGVTILAGGGTALFGLSDVGEGITDYNVIQEAVFMGNEDAYNLAEDIFMYTAIVGTAICGVYGVTHTRISANRSTLQFNKKPHSALYNKQSKVLTYYGKNKQMKYSVGFFERGHQWIHWHTEMNHSKPINNFLRFVWEMAKRGF